MIGLLGCLVFSGAARAEYRLAPGDRVEVTAIGVPDLRQQLTIGIDGEISVALLGRVKAAGLTVDALQADLQKRAAAKTFRPKTGSDSREFMVLDAQDVSVAIVAYRPLYVSGDVAKPGSQVFTPGMTARQAVSLAGGCDLTRFGVQNPIMTSADVRSDYERLWIDYASQQLRVNRLQAELSGADRIAFDEAAMRQAPVEPALLKELLRLETEKLGVRQRDFEAQRRFLTTARATANARLDLLRRQRAQEEEGVRLDESESDRIADLQKRSVLPMYRVAEVRRISLLSATRALQVSVQVEEVDRQQQQLGRDLDALIAKRREDLVTELQDAQAKRDAVRIQLRAASDKLVYTGLLRSQISRGYGEPEITLFRKGAVGEEQGRAGLESSLDPGDALQVRCPFVPDGAWPATDLSGGQATDIKSK